MTVQTSFRNWQSAPLQPDPLRCAPICLTWSSWLRSTWGGQDLGCYVARPIVGGSSPSSHGSGAATDWRYQDPGPGRQRMLDEVLPRLLNDSLELGIQAIHDYVGCRIWRPPGLSGRPSQISPECGWRDQTPGSQMGQSWALWLHIECIDTRWADTRSVPEMLDDTPSIIPEPDPDEEDDVRLYLVLYPNSQAQFVTDTATFKTPIATPDVAWQGVAQLGWISATPGEPDPIVLEPGWAPFLDSLPTTVP